MRESFTLPPEIAVGAPGHRRDLTRLNAGLTLAAQVQSITWTQRRLRGAGLAAAADRAPTGKLPLITIVHGGPAGGGRAALFRPGAHARAAGRGWALFYPNPRGSFGQGERFTAANVRDFGHGDLRDILAGIDAAETCRADR